MSAAPVHSPIQCLNDDLLWCIIMINADMFEDNTAMKTTLFTSRVCRDWRRFMLTSPSIWAHLVDLDHLHGRADEWSQEFLRRTGTALLWVKAHKCANFVLKNPTHCMKYVLNFVSKNWSRIEKLQATIAVAYVDPSQWTPLYLSAPHLESLNLTFKLPTHDFEHPLMSLIGGSAPMLRDLSFTGFRSSLTASWLHQLTSMELSAKLTVSETLSVLMSTENLVELRLDHTMASHTTSPLPFLTLPKLAYLVLTVFIDVTPSVTLLDHIHIPPACSLRLSAHSIQLRGIVNKNTLSLIVRVISTYAKRHFAHHAPRKVAVGYFAAYFALQVQTHPDKPVFRFCIGLCTKQVFPPHVLAILLSEFSLPDFSKITAFRFTSNALDHPVAKFAAFIACLASVRIVEADEWALRHLIHVQEVLNTADAGSSIMFPALKTLKLRSLPAYSFGGVSDPVSEFIMTRIAHGHAIGILDLTRDALDVLPDMVFLNEAHHLKVLWRQSGATDTLEYICGTGSPQNLLSVYE